MIFRGSVLGSFLVSLRSFREIRNFLTVIAFAVIGMTLNLAGETFAQSGTTVRVQAIEVQGNQRVEADAVRSYMTLASGDRF